MKLIYDKPKDLEHEGRKLRTNPATVWLKDGPLRFRVFWGGEVIYAAGLSIGRLDISWETRAPDNPTGHR